MRVLASFYLSVVRLVQVPFFFSGESLGGGLSLYMGLSLYENKVREGEVERWNSAGIFCLAEPFLVCCRYCCCCCCPMACLGRLLVVGFLVAVVNGPMTTVRNTACRSISAPLNSPGVSVGNTIAILY